MGKPTNVVKRTDQGLEAYVEMIKKKLKMHKTQHPTDHKTATVLQAIIDEADQFRYL